MAGQTFATDMNQDILDFIKGTIPSVWALELLLLLRDNRDTDWTAETAAKELRSNANYIAALLAQFESAGVVMQSAGDYRYFPASPLLDELAGGLAEFYAERPVSVVTAIVSARRDGVQTFADAFRFREGPKK